MSTTATIPTYRYQYRPSSSSSSRLPTSSFSLFTPRNTLPHHYLESPTNIFLPQQQFSTTNSQPQQPEKIIIRQVGGAGDNHVQWVSISEIIPYSEGESSNGGSGGKHGGKPRTKSLKSYTSQVHGIVHTASWPNHDVGDRLWLRSDQPIIKGRRSVPIVNLDKGVSGEVWYVSPSFLSFFTHLSCIWVIGCLWLEERRTERDKKTKKVTKKKKKT